MGTLELEAESINPRVKDPFPPGIRVSEKGGSRVRARVRNRDQPGSGFLLESFHAVVDCASFPPCVSIASTIVLAFAVCVRELMSLV